MDELLKTEEVTAEAPEIPPHETDTAVPEEQNPEETLTTGAESEISASPKRKFTKKQLIIAGAGVLAVIVLLFALFHKSKFEKVFDEAVQIAGTASGDGKEYFVLDTYPDIYENMDSTMRLILLPRAQENALKAIQYANKELGFNGSVYSRMMETNSLMGRQYAENDKYKISWTYHPDDGLEVTYEKK